MMMIAEYDVLLTDQKCGERCYNETFTWWLDINIIVVVTCVESITLHIDIYVNINVLFIVVAVKEDYYCFE